MSLNQLFDLAKAKRLPPAKEIVWNCLKYNWLQPLSGSPFLPKSLLIYVTYRCNARCAMCGIWQEHQFSDAKTELSPDELRGILRDRLFADIEYVNINGGEPTLRGDLVGIAQLITGTLPRLKHLSLNSNGFLSSRLVSDVEQIRDICRHKAIPFSLVISFHGVGKVLDTAFGVDGAFERACGTLEALKELNGDEAPFYSLNCVITNVNAAHLRELADWCGEHNERVNYVLGEVRERFFNQGLVDNTAVSGEHAKEAIDFLREIARRKSLSNVAAYRYARLTEMLEHGTERRMACHYAMGGIIVGSHGDLYYCSRSKSIGNCRDRSPYELYYHRENLRYRWHELLRRECKHCPPNSVNRLELQKDLFRYLRFVLAP